MSAHNAPRPYDLGSIAERDRLLREVRGYLFVSRNNGTDFAGRAHALVALDRAIADGWRIGPATGSAE